MKHCRHCTDPESPAHENPDFREAEENCAFYENPGHLEIVGPPRASEFLRSALAFRKAAKAFAEADDKAGLEASEDRADAFRALVSAAADYLSLATERAAKRGERDG